MRLFQLDIVTPDRVVMSEPVRSMVAPGSEGSFGVLAGHAPMVSELTIGQLRYLPESGPEEIMAVSGGFLEVGGGQVTVLADAAERAQEIDVERAIRARERAREQARQLAEHFDETQSKINEFALQRAANRLRTAGRGD
jgi:F-type H+-transporting ATPase subunit epsilon